MPTTSKNVHSCRFIDCGFSVLATVEETVVTEESTAVDEVTEEDTTVDTTTSRGGRSELAGSRFLHINFYCQFVISQPLEEDVS